MKEIGTAVEVVDDPKYEDILTAKFKDVPVEEGDELIKRSDTKRYALACRDCGFEFWADYHKGLSCPNCGTEVPLIQFSPSGAELENIEKKTDEVKN